MKTNLKNLSLSEIESYLKRNNLPKFRGIQIFQWIMRDVTDIDEMTDLPKDMIINLKEDFKIYKSEILSKQISMIDGTIKYLFEMEDGNAIEAVFMDYKHGNSLCISTQAGCRMDCKFCASGVNGLDRNLTAGEMLEQVLAVQRDTGKRVDSLVLMGTGEPFDNYLNVMKFIRNIIHPKGINLGQRHITVSTSGIIPAIMEFAEENLQCNLAVSLHNPFDSERSEIMPINKKYNVEILMEACREYVEKTHRRVTFEYALIKDKNDGERHARELARLLKGMLCHVNLIPVNNVLEANFSKSSPEDIKSFADILENHGISTTVRRELGADIDAACGQLRLKVNN